MIVDYLILIVLFLCTIIFPDIDFVTIDVAWMAQIAVSSGFYYWKAKSENRTKVPIKVIQSLPEEVRGELDMTQVIISIIQTE